MEPDSQEEYVKKLETKLSELREQRIKVDEANEILRKKLQTLTAHLDDLDLRYGKKEELSVDDEKTPTAERKNQVEDEKQQEDVKNVEDSQNDSKQD